MESNHFNPFGHVIMHFVISKYEFFTSRSGQEFLRFVFILSNENESYEEDQIFLVEDNGDIHPSFNEFVEQFNRFIELKDNITFGDFIGEKGTCYMEPYNHYGKIYRKIKIISLEINEE
ncbi:hypothetical protein [Lysinibacillus sphaericus]|uniref:hypothetical protein n=1 Tax=Lysinibacillus sphaericus TaxID=1421 RepID=UPI001CBF1990|nr:hypothetical protein [Lysinibacillus sphaericus]